MMDVFDKVINNGKFFRNKVLADGKFLLDVESGSFWRETQFLDCFALLLFYLGSS